MSYQTEFIRSVFPRGLRLTFVSLFFCLRFLAIFQLRFFCLQRKIVLKSLPDAVFIYASLPNRS